jgi:ABC-2 type transport system permease protein
MGGMVALGLLVLAVYPILRDTPAVERLMSRIPPTMLRMFGIEPDIFFTGVGYVEAQLYTMMGPIVLLGMTIAMGSAATAREEERGTLDLLVAQPVRRVRVLLEKFAALALLAAAIVSALGATLAIGNESAGLQLTARGLFGANLGLWLLGLFFGAMSMAVGAWLGRRGVAAGIAAGCALLGFFWNGLAPLVEPLAGSESVSPFCWYMDGHPALAGPTRGHAYLAAGTAAWLALACFAFRRRDIGTSVPLLPRRSRKAQDARKDARTVHELRSAPLLATVYGRTIWSRRYNIFWWMLGLCGIAGITIAFWPLLRESPVELESLMKMVPEEVFAMFGIRDPAMMIRPEGFLSARLYATLAPLILIAFAISEGTAAIAGEESKGTLDLQLAQPVSRSRLVAGKFAGMVSWIAFLVMGLIGVIFIGNLAVGLGLSEVGIAGANIGLLLIAVLFGTLAFAVGCATGRPALARGITIAVALATFLLNGLGVYLDALKPFRVLSPFAWYLADAPPLTHGVPAAMLLAPLVTALLYAWAVVSFRRRDIGA